MKTKKGFTLIELMIVVAIIGILAAIAIPKFADLIKKSKEGATKGSLGALRSALTIYYGEQEGEYPKPAVAENALTTTFNTPTGPFLTKYLDKMPTVKLGITGVNDNSNCVYSQEYGTITGIDGRWWYRGATIGEMKVYAANLYDSKSTYITSW
ncbi:MAG: prepilin-type N-terminal cleavage/methylation domain-containing protein [Elusimicrobiota bacterium]